VGAPVPAARLGGGRRLLVVVLVVVRILRIVAMPLVAVGESGSRAAAALMRSADSWSIGVDRAMTVPSVAIHVGPPVCGLLHQFLLDGVHQRQGAALELVNFDQAESQATAGPD